MTPQVKCGRTGLSAYDCAFTSPSAAMALSTRGQHFSLQLRVGANFQPHAVQECVGLQATGVADAHTWKALLGAEAEPAHLADLRADDATDEDLSEIGERVWLLGEQRWARSM